jgi:hypothetical protein
LVPGTQSVRTGTTLVGGCAVPHQVTTTITDVHREIAGVDTVLMLDHEVDGGQVSQESDKQGNVWEKWSRPVDRRVTRLADHLLIRRAVRRVCRLERRAGTHEGDEVGCVDRAPPGRTR